MIREKIEQMKHILPFLPFFPFLTATAVAAITLTKLNLSKRRKRSNITMCLFLILPFSYIKLNSEKEVLVTWQMIACINHSTKQEVRQYQHPQVQA